MYNMEDFQITPDIHKSLLQGYLFGIVDQPRPSTTLNDLPLEVRALIIDCLDADKDDFSLWNVMHISRSWYSQNAIGPWAEKKWQDRVRCIVLGRADTTRIKKSRGCLTWRESYVCLIRSRCMSCKRQRKLRSYRSLLNHACGWMGVCERCSSRDRRFEVIYRHDVLLSFLKKKEVASLRSRKEEYKQREYFRYRRADVLDYLVAKRLRLLAQFYNIDVAKDLSDEDWDILNKAMVSVIVAAEPFSYILRRHVFNLLHRGEATLFKCRQIISTYNDLHMVAVAAAHYIEMHILPSECIRRLVNCCGNETTWWDGLHIGIVQIRDFLRVERLSGPSSGHVPIHDTTTSSDDVEEENEELPSIEGTNSE